MKAGCPKGRIQSPEERALRRTIAINAWEGNDKRRIEQSKWQKLRIKKLWADRKAGVISGKYKNSDLVNDEE